MFLNEVYSKAKCDFIRLTSSGKKTAAIKATHLLNSDGDQNGASLGETIVFCFLTFLK